MKCQQNLVTPARLETAPTVCFEENRDYRFKYLNFIKPHLPGGESVHLFLEFTIGHFYQREKDYYNYSKNTNKKH